MNRGGCIAATLTSAIFAAFACATPAAAADAPILDAHTHITASPGGGSFAPALKAELTAMNTFGIRKAIVMSPPRGAFIAANFDYPDFIKDVAPQRDRFAFLGGGGTLNPMMHGIDPAKVTEADRAKFRQSALDILAAGASGFGEMSALHVSLNAEHQYNYAPADHPLLLDLADIAAEHDVPIDLHMDLLTAPEPTPRQLAGYQNPKTLPATLPALEHLLAHNLKAKIVWDHGGSDWIGHLTPQLIGGLMDRYPNLYMSLRPVPAPAPVSNKLFSQAGLNSQWASLLKRHPDRFFIGTDCFYVPPGATGAPAEFSRQNTVKLQATRAFLRLLPVELARKIAYENAAALFKLTLN